MSLTVGICGAKIGGNGASSISSVTYNSGGSVSSSSVKKISYLERERLSYFCLLLIFIFKIGLWRVSVTS